MSQTSTTANSRFRILRDAELEALPDPEFLLAPFLLQRSLTVVYGPPAAGKSFLLLDWASCIASGRSWLGHAVSPGPAVYIAGEGIGGIRKRVQAWKHERRHTGPIGLFIVTSAVQLHMPEHVFALRDELLATIGRPPALIIADTLSRCMVGGDENSSRDIGQAIAGADFLRDQLGATVLLAHHALKNGEAERGSSALRGAADTMFSLREEDGLRSLETTKQKDIPSAPKISLSLESVGGSCVLRLADATAPRNDCSANERTAIDVLQRISLSDGVSCSVWLASAKGAGLSERTFYNARKTLVEKALVSKVGRANYVVSAAGLQELQENCTRGAMQLWGTTAAPAGSLLGDPRMQCPTAVPELELREVPA